MKKSLLVAAIAALLAQGSAYARQLSPAEALEAAGYARSAAGLAAPSARQLIYTASEADGLNTLYVFSGNNGGFMILAADDCCTPLLAYSDSSSFDPENMPENLRSWLNGYSAQIAAAAANGGIVISAPADPSLTDVAPITKTQWNQDAPYNDQSPRVNGRATYTGCVATAVAQVMKTYNWPEHGTGSHSYQWNNTLLSFNYDDTTFEWDLMLDSYRGEATDAQKNAIATLMYGVGVSCNMNFGTGGSGALGINAAIGLASFMDYDASMRYLSRDFFELPLWCRMLHEELAQGYPLYYDGANATVGHAFVIDGYRKSDGLFHVNWGWGGMSNGYYAITTLDPDAQGIGGSTDGYYSGQSALFNLRPQAGGSVVPVIGCDGNFAPESGTVQRDSYVTILDGGVYSYSIGTVAVQFGIALTDAQNNVTYVWDKDGEEDMYYQIDTYYGFSSYPMSLVNLPQTGTFTAKPVVREEDGQVYPVYTTVGATSEATVICDGDNITINPVEKEASLSVSDTELLSPFFRNKLAMVETTITNTGSEYYGLIRAKITTSSTPAKWAEVLVDLPQGHSEKVSFSGQLPFNLKAGKASIGFYDERNHLIGEMIEVDVTTAPTGTAEVTAGLPVFVGAQGLGTEQSPYIIAPEAPELEIPLTATAGYFTDRLYACFFEGDGNYLGYTQGLLRPVAAGNTVMVPFNEDLSDIMVNDNVYIVAPAMLSNGYLTYDIEKAVWFTAGSTSISDVNVNAIGVYPNPVVDTACVSAECGISSVEVYSISGQLVFSQSETGEASSVNIDLSALVAGSYLLKANMIDGSSSTFRLIKK